MPSKLVPSNPSEVTVIRKVTDSITTISAPFYRFGHIRIGGRGTLVRLTSGGVAVFSPTALTPEVKQTVEQLGEVKYITAPDAEHHIFIGPWHEAYPNAKVIGPEGLPEKRAKQKNEAVPFSVIFKAKEKESMRVDSDFDADFDYEFVDAHPNKELVFHHKPSRTLIEADLLFNLPATEQFSRSNDCPTAGLLTKLFIYLTSTQGKAMAHRRLQWYAFSSGNRPSFNRSIARIGSWDFDRMIPCHGDVIETGGKGIFDKIFQWHLDAATKQK